jgi:hypothetical protein
MPFMSSSFNLEVLRRLPLAEGVMRLLRFGLADNLLDDVFRQHHGRSYEDVLRFPQFVHLLADGLFEQQRSGHQTFQRALDEGRVDISLQAIYGKLRRVPISLSLGLFDTASAQMRSVASSVIAQPLPASLQSFWALAFDGKKLKHVLHRLKPLRGLKGNVFGGKLLVVQDMATQQAVAIEAAADGETADNPLVPGAVRRVRALATTKPRLWVADRAFCEYASLPLLAEQGDHFVVRFSAGCKFHAEADMPTRSGVDQDGRSYTEEWGWLGKDQAVRCRKITVTRPGQQPFALVTNLENADQYPADDLLALYRRRWGIETMFQQVVQTFALRHLIGGTPQGTIFQAVLCFLVYNSMLTIRDYIAVASHREPSKISTKTLFDDVADELTGLLKLVEVGDIMDMFRAYPLDDARTLRTYLQEILADVWCNRWTKAGTRKQPAQRRLRAYLCGGHSSVDKIIRGKHHEISFDNLPDHIKPQEASKDV